MSTRNQHPDLHRLAERVVHSWIAAAHTSRMDIPLGTIATLTLIEVKDPAGPDLATQWAELDDGELTEVMRSIWGAAWYRQPYLVEVARPLHEWLSDELSPDLLAGVRSVVATAFQQGLLSFTAHNDPAVRAEVDVLGAVMTELRAPGDRKHRGEYHTPPAVCDLMASMTIDELLPPGAEINEPAVGSGGLVRAAAQRIRELGGDPRDYIWSMSDIDRYATAACAVNAMLWGLGDRVLIFCGDALKHADARAQAAEHRRQVLRHHEAEIRQARQRFAFHRLDRLFAPAARAA